MKVDFDYGFGDEGLGSRIVVNGKTIYFQADYDKKKRLNYIKQHSK